MREEPENIDHDRRKFTLGSLAAGAGLLSIPPELRGLFSVITSSEAATHTPAQQEKTLRLKESYIKRSVEIARKKLATPELKRALKGEGEVPIERVLDTVRAPILKEHTDRTIFDVNELHRLFPVQISGPTSARRFASSYDRAKSGEGYRERHTANGFYWEDKKHLMSAAHAILGEQNLRENRSVDIGILDLPVDSHALSSEQIIHDDRTLVNEDIHGSLVAIIGVGPRDWKASQIPVVQKTFLGVAFRAEPGFASAIRYEPREPSESHVARSFGVVLSEEDDSTAKGMTGSPVFVYKNASWQFCGLYWGNSRLNILREEKNVVLGLFHGIDDIREEVKRPDMLRKQV